MRFYQKQNSFNCHFCAACPCYFCFDSIKVVCIFHNSFFPSFLSFCFLIQLQLEVHEAKPVPENHPQWDTAIEGDEDQEDSEGFEDSFEEEEEEEEDDD